MTVLIVFTPLSSPRRRRSRGLLPPALTVPPHGSSAFAEDDELDAGRMTICWDVSTVVIPSHSSAPP